jgi:hypothetical protein
MSYHPHDQRHGVYSAHAAYASTGQYATTHAAYSQSGAAPQQHHHQVYATPQSASSSHAAQAAYTSAHHHHHQQQATSFPSSSSNSKPKDKKSKRKQATLLEVEQQWAAGYPKSQSGTQHPIYEHQYATTTTNQSRYAEPNFAAFTLAGGRSYLEDGSPSPLSSAGAKGGSGGY